jgi:desulfoferrodoxin-like iron-binding protein
MHCPICGRKAHCLNDGKGPLICCGQPMQKVSVAEAEGWSGRPKGWTQKSTKKFAKSLTGKSGKSKGFFDKCVEKMRGKVDNPEGFCAGAKDEIHGSTYWRGKGKTPQQAGKDAKAHQNVKKG